MQPLISVIIPVYNAENYLHVCLQSVIDQTYKNLEIILINDGSTDNSFQVCDKFLSLDSRIKVVNQENFGVCAARNIGLDCAKGKYILHLDNDDYLSNYCITELHNLLVDNSASIAIGNIIKVDNGRSQLMGNDKFNSIEQILDSKTALMNMYEHSLGLSLLFVLITGKLFDAKLFEKIRFPMGKAFDDEHVNYKLFIKANRIVYTPRPVYTHNIRLDSLSRIPYGLTHLDRITMLEERLIVYKSLEFMHLYQKTLYVYFHVLIDNFLQMSEFFPSKIEILNNIKMKLLIAKESLLNENKLPLKLALLVRLYYYFPFIIIIKKKLGRY